MIDAVSIFTKGGLVLWALELFPIDKLMVSDFIKECLIEGQNSEMKYVRMGYEFRWIPVNRLNAFVLIIFKGILENSYVESMLGLLKAKLISKSVDGMPVPIDLSTEFSKILDKCDQQKLGSKPLASRGVSSRKETGRKSERSWGISNKTSAKTMESLDFSKPMDSDQKLPSSAYFGDTEDECEVSVGEVDTKSGLIGRLVSSLQTKFTGNAEITKTDLSPILTSFQEGLMTKNVARDVAVKIVDSVGNSLVGTRTERFTSLGATVASAITRSIEQILTPKKSIDVLKAALDVVKSGGVYSIVFLGVNGVGKSTNLAKVAYYLKNKGGLRVMIAACDTFRSGAVEQLKTHANALGVDLFERGYGKDSSDIAKQAIAYAQSEKYDVCLIDTAGRMQDNEPLMRAIAKLVATNEPNLILFVGEALVGHDAVDQLIKFNRALIDFAHTTATPRTIDGMILTKYDTVDDKVGAALSMVYVTGQPIVFVGTGQKYPHLRKLHVAEVVKALVG